MAAFQLRMVHSKTRRIYHIHASNRGPIYSGLKYYTTTTTSPWPSGITGREKKLYKWNNRITIAVNDCPNAWCISQFLGFVLSTHRFLDPSTHYQMLHEPLFWATAPQKTTKRHVWLQRPTVLINLCFSQRTVDSGISRICSTDKTNIGLIDLVSNPVLWLFRVHSPKQMYEMIFLNSYKYCSCKRLRLKYMLCIPRLIVSVLSANQILDLSTHDEMPSQIARFVGPTWGPSRADRTGHQIWAHLPRVTYHTTTTTCP